MAHPIRVCAVCGEEFELKPDKPGFANRCPACSAADASENPSKQARDAADVSNKRELNAERRRAMRDLLYRKDN